MRHFILSVFCLLICSLASFAQTATSQLNRDTGLVKFVTSDIDNFWRAYDLASKETETEKRASIFQSEYLDKGSAGLTDFVRLRIKSAKDLVAAIDRQPKYYASIRPATLRVKEMEKQMRKCFRNFKNLYADAVFPDVYFLIGVSDTGGTTSPNGLLIGTEMYGATPRTPQEELPDWLKVVLKGIEKLPAIVAHELIHFNQKYPPVKTLLDRTIKEGSADFLGEMISQDTINPIQKTYGDQHEAELWQEFQREMNGTSMKNWVYNGSTIKDKPSDLGYYMGCKISESYYKNMKDKKQAIRDILEIKDFTAFLEKSRYQEKFLK
jgi:hypothetical protein